MSPASTSFPTAPADRDRTAGGSHLDGGDPAPRRSPAGAARLEGFRTTDPHTRHRDPRPLHRRTTP
jgi:hypothetical protein